MFFNKLKIVYVTIFGYFCIMTQKDKLVARFLTIPADFHYDEVMKLLNYYGFYEVEKGKTSGSRVRFVSKNGVPIMFHKPHPNGILKKYQLKQIREVLKL